MKTPLFVREQTSYMVHSDPFSYHFLTDSPLYATEGIETMGVAVKNDRPVFYFNNDFVQGLDSPEVLFCLKHEVLHLVLHHCDLRCSPDPIRAMKENIAMDLAINQLIEISYKCKPPTTKEDRMVTDYKGQQKFVPAGTVMALYPEDYKYPRGLSFEQYLALLDKDYPDNAFSGKSPEGIPEEGSPFHNPPTIEGPDLPGAPIDNHSAFDSNKALGDFIRKEVGRLRKSKVWGNLPGDLASIIELAQKEEVPWQKYIKRYYGDFITYAREYTRRKAHKRLGYQAPGISYSVLQSEVHVYVDTSASVADLELSKFARETTGLSRIVPLYLNFFDTEVKGTPKLIKHKLKPADFKAVGRGGTDFQAVIDHALKHRVKQLVILSDGYCGEPDYKGFKGDIIWVITPDGSEAVREFRGKKVYIKNLD